MNFKDRLVECSECGKEFVLGVGRQRKMAAKGEFVEPRLCPKCRTDPARRTRLSGSVRWFDPVKGYGFIQRDDGRGEVFVHYSDIRYVGFKVLYEGERVEFGLRRDRRGERAVNVTGHDALAP